MPEGDQHREHRDDEPRLPRRPAEETAGRLKLLAFVALGGAAGAVARYGAPVLRGIAGYGASAVFHTEEILPALDGMIGGGLITLERARVVVYRPARRDDE